ncbi:MAG: hypothetical protein ACE14W_07245 [Candidatus Velamenicoccus archaeovorus]
MPWSKRVTDFLKGALVILALVVALLAVAGVLRALRGSACDRLNAERVSHLEPGHEAPGPGSMYVKGVGPGPPPSELDQYLEAEAAMLQAGCKVPGSLLLPPGG